MNLVIDTCCILIKNDQSFLPRSGYRCCFGVHWGSMGCLIMSLCLELLDKSFHVCLGYVRVFPAGLPGHSTLWASLLAHTDLQLCVIVRGNIQDKYLVEL